MTWHAGYSVRYGIGTIDAEEERGRRYFMVRVQFPPPSDWWPRSTETGSLEEARAWIKQQASEWSVACGFTDAPTPPLTAEEKK